MQFYQFLENPKVYNLIIKIFSFNNSRLKEYLPELLKVKEGDRLLDVGCGTGRYAVFPCNYVGIDPNKDYLQYARKYNQGTFLEMDGADLKFSDNTFDFVVNISTFHHVSDETATKMVNEMKRVCKKDGYVYVVDAVYPKNLLGDLLFKLDRGCYQKNFRQLNDFLTRHDFKVVTEKVEKTFPYQWSVFSYQKPN